MVEIINDISHIKDFDSFKHDGFETGLLNVDNTAFDDTRWPPLKKEFLNDKAKQEIEKIKTQLEPILKKRYNNIKLRNSGIWQGYVEGVRGNVIVYLDKAPYTTDNFIEVTALDRCKIFPEQGEYVWFNDNIKFHRRFNTDEVNNIRFIYFDYKLTNDNDE